MHRGNPHDRNPGCARVPNIKQALRFLQPIGLDVGSQQGELDQVVLCTVAANTIVWPASGASASIAPEKSPRSISKAANRVVVPLRL
jgi:hypothetical protein